MAGRFEDRPSGQDRPSDQPSSPASYGTVGPATGGGQSGTAGTGMPGLGATGGGTSGAGTAGMGASGMGTAGMGTAGATRQPMGQTGGQIGDAAQRLADTGRQTAGGVADQVRQQAKTRLHDQKDRASQGVGNMAQALRQTGQQLRDQDQAGVSQFAEQAADTLERVAGYLGERDVEDLVREAERFARRQPVVFLGAAFGLGFLAARFLTGPAHGGVGGVASGLTEKPSPIWKEIDVNVPVRTAYNQWTQFEEFPQFMGGVQEVRQLDDRRQHWRAVIAGKEEEWDAEIIEQIPDRRIAWRSTTGPENSGIVAFRSLGPDRTRVALLLDYEPRDAIEQVGSALGFVDRQVEGDLQRFKQFIESRGTETGAWRGEIHDEPAAGRL